MADGHDVPYGYFYSSENVQNQIGCSQSLPVSGFRHFPETLGNSMGYWSPRGESPSDSSEEARGTSRRSYEKWTEEQEMFLLDLWAEYENELESSQSRKYWAKIENRRRLNNRFQGSWSKDQIQRKIRYLKEKFKKASDWNRRQTGGNRKTSPHYEKISEILGKKDSVTFKHVIWSFHGF